MIIAASDLKRLIICLNIITDGFFLTEIHWCSRYIHNISIGDQIIRSLCKTICPDPYLVVCDLPAIVTFEVKIRMIRYIA